MSGRSLVSQRAGEQPRDRVNDDCRSQFAAAQYVIADRNLLIGEVLGHALVHAFVAPTDQDNAIETGEFLRHILAEQAALRRQQHNCLIGALGAWRHVQRFHHFEQRLRFEHHALATAEWPIVHRAMPVAGVHAHVVDADIDQPSFSCAPHNPVVQRPAKEVRENRNNVEAHSDGSMSLTPFFFLAQRRV